MKEKNKNINIVSILCSVYYLDSSVQCCSVYTVYVVLPRKWVYADDMYVNTCVQCCTMYTVHSVH